MGEAEDIVRQREAQRSSETQELYRSMNGQAVTQIEQDIPVFLDLMHELSYPEYTTFVKRGEEELIAWKLFDYVGEGDIRGKRLYLLSTGEVVLEDVYGHLGGGFVETDLREDARYGNDYELDYNAKVLKGLIDGFSQRLPKN